MSSRALVRYTALVLIGTALITALHTSHGAAQASARPALPVALAHARQLVLVVTPAWDSTTGVLRRYTRARVHDPWRAAGDAIPIVVGRTGLAWGTGYADARQPDGPRKREGDGRSPAGAFPLSTAFGFAPRDSMRWVQLPYVPLVATTDCVDDTTSTRYNTLADRATVTRVDWRSAEHMRTVGQYRIGVVVAYNVSPPRRGAGSCIFLHIWAGPRSTTVGCTAMDEQALAGLIAWLDPKRRPVLVQLPAAAYARLRNGWALPAR